MTARAESAQLTREQIMSATFALSTLKPIMAINLPDIANLAEVSVQTVLRHFGSREGVLDATTAWVQTQVLAERESDPGNVPAAIRTLIDHYELRGDGVLLLLGQESWEPRAAQITADGRLLHRTWVAHVFSPLLTDASQRSSDATDTDAGRRNFEVDINLKLEAMLDLLVVATDVYAWKLLRRDRRLSRSDTEKLMLRLVGNVLKGQ
jgi:AcrR family transcriptional regulator